MTTTTTANTCTASHVLVYVPNLIGYGRVLCTLSSLFLMIAFSEFWILAIALYISSFVGDLFGK
jgi:phosphatidylglycerophosphate synthase